MDALASGDDPLYKRANQELPADSTPADYVTSLLVSARAPAR